MTMLHRSAMISRLGSEIQHAVVAHGDAVVHGDGVNSPATPPTRSISRATSWPRSFRCTWPGTNWVKELAMAMIGL
ncbi:hypothetical protein [Curtobacterium flaccumfaciens]|uniref:hypothetical protein n=1 Tax=Curtobacterium flaccumfaciens TaxID=2035 RepID=UPI00215B06C0|nr:hypothetical protein [Curtobacterium flaccumfaciens]